MGLFGWICVSLMVAGVPLTLVLHYRRHTGRKPGVLTKILVGLWLALVFDYNGAYAKIRWNNSVITASMIIATLLTIVVGGGICWLIGEYLSPRLAKEMQSRARRKAWQDRHWTSKSK